MNNGRFDQEEAEMATGAPDEKIEALVIFFPELPMLLVNGQWGK